MKLVIVGTIGLDDIETPFGKVEGVLGGSGSYSAVAASYFVRPGLISVVGDDFPKSALEYFKKIDKTGILKTGKTFRWGGFYEFDMNEAKTLNTQLNSLALFKPEVPEKYKKAEFILLANIDPVIQLEIISQAEGKPFIVADTMNYWISSKKDQLISVIKKSNIIVANEGEARQLFGEPNLIKAGKKLLELGPEYAVIKKGEHGALLFSAYGLFSAPGYPLEGLKDPTGCGDSFAGGLIGYLASKHASKSAGKPVSFEEIRKAVIYGSAVASCCAESFSLDYKKTIKLKDIKERVKILKKIGKF